MTQSVYVIAAHEDGPCKIGISANPAARLAELQTGCPAKLHLVMEEETDNARRLEEENAVRAIANWGAVLLEPNDPLIVVLARDVGNLVPPKPTIAQILQLAALILEEPEYRGALREYLKGRHRAKSDSGKSGKKGARV